MRLSGERIREFALGAARVEERADGIVFHRFLEEERECYRANAASLVRSYSGSGIVLDFVTDARSFSFDARLSPASSRNWGFFDLEIDGLLAFHIGSGDVKSAPDVRFSAPFDGGRHHCTLHLPQLACAALRNVELEGATFAEARPRRCRILFYGDSITQGYDAKYPSLTYAARLAAEFDAEIRNKAIGGDTFRPELLAAPQPEWIPDLIVTAYGTNDWARCAETVFRQRATAFFAALGRIYPGIPVAALQPIWRADGNRCTAAGTFGDAARIVTEAARSNPDAVVIPGLKLVPHLTEFFADGQVHPDDLGFTFYAKNLIRELRAAGLPRPR